MFWILQVTKLVPLVCVCVCVCVFCWWINSCLCELSVHVYHFIVFHMSLCILLMSSLAVSQNYIVVTIGVQALWVCSVFVFSPCFIPLRVRVDAVMYFRVDTCMGLVQRVSQAVFHISLDTVSLFYVTWSLVYFLQLCDCFVTCDFRPKSCCYGSYILQRCW